MGERSILIVHDDALEARDLARRLEPTRPCVIARGAAALPRVRENDRAWCGFLVNSCFDGRSGFDLVVDLRAATRRSVPAAIVAERAEAAARANEEGCRVVAKPWTAGVLRYFLHAVIAFDLGVGLTMGAAFQDVASEYRLSAAEADVLARGVMREPIQVTLERRANTERTYRELRKRLIGKMRAADFDDACRMVMARASAMSALREES